MKSLLLATVLLVTLFAGCADRDESPPPVAEPKSAPIENLWIADQFTGMLGIWMRLQQRWLISSSSIAYQSLDLRQGDGTRVEIFTDTSDIATHLTSDHGGVIELKPMGSDLLTITREFNGETDEWTELHRFAEKFEREEDWENYFVLYRWLDEGKVDLIQVYEEEDTDRPKLDPNGLLAILADAEAFNELRWIDEESLLPNDPVFVNHTELSFGLTAELQPFPAASKSAFEKVSAALDRKREEQSNTGDPEHLGGIGIFTNAHRFGKIFRPAMIEAGYNPYTSSFAFAAAQMTDSMGTVTRAEDKEMLKALQTQFDPYAEWFEGSLRKLLDSPGPPEAFSTFTKAEDYLNPPLPRYYEADSDEEVESLPLPPPPPLVQ